jgi:hypothetical protein
MHTDPSLRARSTATLTIAAEDVDRFRYMLREQVAGDTELLREVAAGFAEHDPAEATRRVALVWSIAEQLGGIY